MRFSSVETLVRRMDEARIAVEEGRRALSGEPSVTASGAFGGTSEEAYTALQASADKLAGVLIGVLDADGERLGKVIKAFKEMDDELADGKFTGAEAGFDLQDT